MSDQTIKQTLSLTVGDEEFVFRVPSPMDKARVGVREATIRRQLDPMGGFGVAVDDETFYLIRGMALFEVLLERASTQWPYSEVKPDRGQAELKVDIEKFPPGKEAVIGEVGRRFQDELDRFHRDRDQHQQPNVSEAVASS